MKVNRLVFKYFMVACAFVCMGNLFFAYGQTPADSAAIARCAWDTIRKSDGLVVCTARLQLYGSRQSVSVAVLDPGKLSLHVAQPAKKRRKVSEQARDLGAVVAVNGGFFASPDPKPADYVQVGGVAVNPKSLTAAGGNGALLTDGNRVAIRYWKRETAAEEARQWQDILVSNNMLVHDGEILSSPDNVRSPHTMIGTDGERVFLVVVDGRLRGKADGMTRNEGAFLMLQLGARDVLNLDGGGSSALWLKGTGIVNHPSDNGRFDHRGERKVGSIVYAR